MLMLIRWCYVGEAWSLLRAFDLRFHRFATGFAFGFKVLGGFGFRVWEF